LSSELLGKVLLIDDKFDSVRELVENLTSNGIPVLFWNGKDKVPRSVLNVRVIMLDLDLIGSGTGEWDYGVIIATIKDIPGPYSVLIVSVNYNDDAPGRLTSTYHDVTGRELPGFVIPRGFTKNEAQDVKQVIDALKTSLRRNQVLRIILLAELVLNKGRDDLLARLSTEHFDDAVKALIKNITGDFGEDSTARELLLLIARLQTRNMSASEIYDELKEAVRSLPAPHGASGSDARSRVENLRMYSQPDDREELWTGDIFKTGVDRDVPQYDILITPSCDLSQDKCGYLKFCRGYPRPEAGQTRGYHPLLESSGGISLERIARWEQSGGHWPARYYLLSAFVDEKYRKEPIIVVFDFQRILSVRTDTFSSEKHVRVCRLDSPYIEDLLQKYGSYSFRLGTPSRLSS